MGDTSRYNPQIHHRKSIRLKGYDYSKDGLYFITICTQHRACLFGNVVIAGAPLVGAQNNDTQNKNDPHFVDDIQNDSVVQNKTDLGNDDGQQKRQPQGFAPTGIPTLILNDPGEMVENEWVALPKRFTNIELHEFVVMPNHFHGILQIITPSDKTVSDMMDAFKSITTVEYIRGVKQSGWRPFNGKLWQRNYWEHIIRDEQSYHTISNYIVNNPAKWEDDKLYHFGNI
jgi:putative transposase